MWKILFCTAICLASASRSIDEDSEELLRSVPDISLEEYEDQPIAAIVSRKLEVEDIENEVEEVIGKSSDSPSVREPSPRNHKAARTGAMAAVEAFAETHHHHAPKRIDPETETGCSHEGEMFNVHTSKGCFICGCFTSPNMGLYPKCVPCSKCGDEDHSEPPKCDPIILPGPPRPVYVPVPVYKTVPVPTPVPFRSPVLPLPPPGYPAPPPFAPQFGYNNFMPNHEPQNFPSWRPGVIFLEPLCKFHQPFLPFHHPTRPCLKYICNIRYNYVFIERQHKSGCRPNIPSWSTPLPILTPPSIIRPNLYSGGGDLALASTPVPWSDANKITKNADPESSEEYIAPAIEIRPRHSKTGKQDVPDMKERVDEDREDSRMSEYTYPLIEKFDDDSVYQLSRDD